MPLDGFMDRKVNPAATVDPANVRGDGCSKHVTTVGGESGGMEAFHYSNYHSSLIPTIF